MAELRVTLVDDTGVELFHLMTAHLPYSVVIDLLNNRDKKRLLHG